MNRPNNLSLINRIKLSRHLTVGPQPDEEMLQTIHKDGFKTIINMCHKGEHGQLLSPEEEAEKAKELGMEYFHFPVSMTNMKSDQANKFCQLMADSEKPVYLHCRIGQRSGPFALIYHGLRRKLSADDVMEKKDKLGFSWQAPLLDSFIRTMLKKEAA